MTLSCIVCNLELEHVFKDLEGEIHNQPSGGTTFTSQGHYGSTVFDPDDGSFIEVNICDRCLGSAARYRKVLFYKRKQLPAELHHPPEVWDGK